MPYRIADPQFWYTIERRFGTAGGEYLLKCFQHDKEVPTPIHRLLGVDNEGVLYIGMAISFLDRVIELKKSHSPGHISRAHECGGRYKDNPDISSRFPYERLSVTLLPSEDPRSLERDHLQAYCQRFGELPSLNRAG